MTNISDPQYVYTVKEVARDGNCFFAAMLVVLGHLNRDYYSANTSRATSLRNAIRKFFNNLLKTDRDRLMRLLNLTNDIDAALGARYHAAVTRHDFNRVSSISVPSQGHVKMPEELLQQDLREELESKAFVSLGRAAVIGMILGVALKIYVMEPAVNDEDTDAGLPILWNARQEMRDVLELCGLDANSLKDATIVFQYLGEPGEGHFRLLEVVKQEER